MLKNKFYILLSLFSFMTAFSFAESKNNTWPHLQFKRNAKSFYRIEGDLPSLGIVKFKENDPLPFPINDMGVLLSGIYSFKCKEWSEKKYFACVTIIPTINFINENTKLLLEKKGGDIFWEDYEWYAMNCHVDKVIFYEKGISLSILNLDSPTRFTKVFLELKADGKYYECEDDGNLGFIKKYYENFDEIPFQEERIRITNAQYPGFVFFSIDNKEKKVEDIIVQGIKYFNKTDKGVEFITPYGSGFYSFETEQINLVDKELYIGKTFNYFKWNHIDWWYHGKIAKKVITRDDFNITTEEL